MKAYKLISHKTTLHYVKDGNFRQGALLLSLDPHTLLTILGLSEDSHFTLDTAAAADFSTVREGFDDS